MSLLRFAGRSMLASFFIVNGVKAVTNPAPLVEDAERIAKNFVPLVQKVVPPTVANYIPDDTTTLVRATGVAQVAGGLMLATGIGRQLGAGLLGLSMVPHVLASRPKKDATSEERSQARGILLRNVALLGGAILATLDTEGKPNLAWLADDRRKRLAVEAGRAGDQIAAATKRTGRGVAKEARRAAKQAAKDAKATQKALARELKLAGSNAKLQVASAQRAVEKTLS